MPLHVLHHRAGRTHGAAQLLARYAKLVCPILDFVILIRVDSHIIRFTGLLEVISHLNLQKVKAPAKQRGLLEPLLTQAEFVAAPLKGAWRLVYSEAIGMPVGHTSNRL